jgi:hypothetical protein
MQLQQPMKEDAVDEAAEAGAHQQASGDQRTCGHDFPLPPWKCDANADRRATRAAVASFHP